MTRAQHHLALECAALRFKVARIEQRMFAARSPFWVMAWFAALEAAALRLEITSGVLAEMAENDAAANFEGCI